MVEAREPRKGQGVPGETHARKSIADLREALAQAFPDVSCEGLQTELEQRVRFDAGMQQHVRSGVEPRSDLARYHAVGARHQPTPAL